MTAVLSSLGLPDAHARAPQYLSVTLSETAMQIGRQSVLADHNLFSAWLDQQEAVREPSDYYGPISTPELLRMVLTPEGCTDAQLRAACQLLSARYLEQESESVLQLAQRAMEA